MILRTSQHDNKNSVQWSLKSHPLWVTQHNVSCFHKVFKVTYIIILLFIQKVKKIIKQFRLLKFVFQHFFLKSILSLEYFSLKDCFIFCHVIVFEILALIIPNCKNEYLCWKKYIQWICVSKNMFRRLEAST